MQGNDQQISVVLLTYNRVGELTRSLDKLLAMPEQPPVIVVDNASTDARAFVVAQRHPRVQCISLLRNIGGAGRNAGVRLAATPYVAFCDDDSWRENDALGLAVEILDHYPDVAALCGRVLLGEDCREDPTCAEMAASPCLWRDCPARRCWASLPARWCSGATPIFRPAAMRRASSSAARKCC